ncbi:hypothetical protein HRI_000926700 [Hibiscus trionum]|uniref:DC1 domain-containing protein n=1 Tax=Hibiscus trionum TaxID=183268 RepID=A0A9W7LPW6_HIBTR|nr:hypothetical protein HRI_000926700 [Hibiscus trionum]
MKMGKPQRWNISAIKVIAWCWQTRWRRKLIETVMAACCLSQLICCTIVQNQNVVCAELPRINQHWFRQSNATLQSADILRCDLCRRECSGFFYEIGGWFYVCLRCAKVGDIIESEGRQHLIFFYFKCNEQPCNGCGTASGSYGAFRCGNCSTFSLDFGCLTLPQSTLHKCDQHMLYLTYRDDNNYKEHNYCDICEGERDRSLWYYHCSICAHPDCALGRFPFLRDGTSLTGYYGLSHSQDLLYFKKTEGYPECSHCGKLCLEEILICAQPTCNFIIHFKCCWK